MYDVNKCPKCKRIIFGTYCANCNEDIRDIDVFENFFGIDMNNIFGGFDNGNKEQE